MSSVLEQVLHAHQRGCQLQVVGLAEIFVINTIVYYFHAERQILNRTVQSVFLLQVHLYQNLLSGSEPVESE
jgi:hypothetical protein